MQDEINEKVVALVINYVKMGASELRRALEKYLHESGQKHKDGMQQSEDVVKHGKQSVAKLMEQNTGLSNIEVTDGNIKDFEKTARKYNIDFALKKDSAVNPPKYIVFFKARDVDVMTEAFKDYTKVNLKKSQVKQSVRKKLSKAMEAVKNLKQREKVKTKDRGQDR